MKSAPPPSQDYRQKFESGKDTLELLFGVKWFSGCEENIFFAKQFIHFQSFGVQKFYMQKCCILLTNVSIKRCIKIL